MKNFVGFSKKYFWLYLILFLIPILIFVGVYIYVTQKHLALTIDMIINLIFGFLTYFSSSLLGIIVFFNTYNKQEFEESFNYTITQNIFFEDGIKQFLYIDDIKKDAKFAFNKNQYLNPFELPKECFFVSLKITNYNNYHPMNIQLDKWGFIDKSNSEIDDTSTSLYYTDFNMNEPLEYKQSGIFYVGISNSLYKKYYGDEKYNGFFFYFSLYNSTGRKEYIKYIINEGVAHPLKLSLKKYKKIQVQ